MGTIRSLESVSLADLNRLRHKSAPIPMRTLRRRAAIGVLPGAWSTGTRWMVVLSEYDKAILDQVEADRHDTESTDTVSLADQIYKQLVS